MEAAPVKRRLSAILLADVVAYSRLMGADEDGTHSRLAACLNSLIKPKIVEYGGRPVRNMGDGLLVEFDSAVVAVRCAADIQHSLAEHDSSMPPDRRIRLRIGINTGDVIVDDRDIYGNSVNIAARLETLAGPGEIYISQSVYEQTRGQPGIFFADKGLFHVKNIDYPIRAFQIVDKDVAAPRPQFRVTSRPVSLSVATIAFALTVSISGIPFIPDHLPGTDHHPNSTMPANSIIVLPFRNIGGNPDEEYLADAITDELSTDLSRLQKTLVISSTTALAYKQKPTDIRQIGHEVGARFALEGGVKRVGATVQINAQLIDTRTGEQIWADRFSQESTSLLTLEEALTSRVAATLNVQLRQARRRPEIGTLAADGNPLDERLRAMAVMAGPSFNKDRSLKARQHIDAALQVYPESAELLAVLANLLISDYLNSWNNVDSAEVDTAEWAARKALSLDASQPVANYALGMVLRVRGAHKEALDAFQAAIDRNPNFARAYAQKANQLVFLRRPKEEVLPAVQQAILLSPKEPFGGSFYWIEGRANFVAQDWPNAVKSLNTSVEVQPGWWFNRAWLIAAYEMQGDRDSAQRELDKLTQRFPSYTLSRIIDHYTNNARHQQLDEQAKNNLFEGLRKAGLQ